MSDASSSGFAPTSIFQRALNRVGGEHPAAWLVGCWAAVWSVVVGYLLVLGPVLLAWLGEGAEDPLVGPVGVAGQVWLVANGAEVVFGGGRFGLAPLGLTLVMVVLVLASVRSATKALRAGLGYRALSLRMTGVVIGCSTITYAALAGLLASQTQAAASWVDPVQSAVTAGVLGAVGASMGALTASGAAPALRAALPDVLVRNVRPALIAAGTLIAGGAALVALAVLTHLGAISDTFESLQTGWLGGLVLTIAGVAYLFDGVVWAMSYLVGPGFSLGTDTALDAANVDVSILPGFPPLAAVPHGVPLLIQVLAHLVPVVAGVLAARAIWSASPGRRRLRLVGDAAVTGALSGLTVGLLALASAGPAGPQRLAQVGPVASEVALAATAEIAIVAALTVLVLLKRESREQARTPDSGTVADTDADTEADTGTDAGTADLTEVLA